MTYRQGEVILASDFNTFRTSLLAVWDVGNGDTGYGQIDTGGASAIPAAVIGADVTNAEWEAFRDAAQLCSDHQGSVTTFPPASELLTGQPIEAHDPLDGNAYDIGGSLTTITTNRLNVDGGSTTLFSNIINSTRSTAWNTSLEHRFTAVLPTVDDARYFFNSGGQIRMRGSRSGGSATSQNTNWTNLLTNMGTINLRANDTTQTGGGGSWTVQPIGYFDLTTSFQVIASGFGTGNYAANTVDVRARTLDGPTGPNGDTGRQIEISVRYRDLHTNGFFDSVNGTITSDIDYQIATSPLTIQTPIFASSILLTAGS